MSPLRLWYGSPAQGFNEGLPVGNGRLGALALGGVPDETIYLNEDTLWSGFPRDRNDPGCAQALPEVRRLIAEGELAKAQALVEEAESGAVEEEHLGGGAAAADEDTACPICGKSSCVLWLQSREPNLKLGR